MPETDYNALFRRTHTAEELSAPLRPGPASPTSSAPSGLGVEPNTLQMIKDGYTAVYTEHRTTSHQIATWASRAVMNKINSLSRADAAKLAVSGGVILAGALTGGVAIGVALAIGGGGYIIKKGIDRYASYKRNQALRWRWIDLGTQYTDLDPSERETKKAELAKVANTDAKVSVRKCIVHLRKAIEHYKKSIKTPPTDLVWSCDGAVAAAKPIYKFIHEFDKFRSYLLPNMLAVSTMIANHRETASKWRAAAREIELKLDSHVRKNWHGACEEGKCYHRAIGIVARAEAPRQPGAEITTNMLNNGLAAKFDTLVEAVATNKSMSQGRGEAYRSSPDQDKRWLRFRQDLLRRYDDPSRGRQVRHFFVNRNNATTKGEKVAIAVGTLMELSLLAGDPFLDHAVEGLSFIAKHAASSGTSAGEQLVEMLAETQIVVQGNSIEGPGTGAATGVARGPIAGAVNGDQYGLVPADGEFKSDADVKAAFKYDAVAAEKLIGKMERHWQAALDTMQTCQTYLGMRYFRTCGEAMVLAIGLAEVGHHLGKFEKYMLAYYAIVHRFVQAAEKLSEAERRAYTLLETLKPAVAKEEGHDWCRDHGSVCYGPKTVIHGIITKRYSRINDQPHKPLS